MRVERVLNLVEDQEYAPGRRALVEGALRLRARGERFLPPRRRLRGSQWRNGRAFLASGDRSSRYRPVISLCG